MDSRSQRGSHVLVVEPTQAEAVRQVFALRAQGFSMHRIAEEMNAQNIPTHEGSAWHAVQVKRVLDRRPLYCGQYEYGGITTTEGKQERILNA